MIDDQGDYSLQIYKPERPRLHAGSKAKRTPGEYKAVVMGSSTHYGKLRVEPNRGVLVFHILGVSFPNWEGQVQRRQYELKDGVLSYRVTARPNGDVPISIWRRVKSKARQASVQRSSLRSGVEGGDSRFPPVN